MIFGLVLLASMVLILLVAVTYLAFEVRDIQQEHECSRKWYEKATEHQHSMNEKFIKFSEEQHSHNCGVVRRIESFETFKNNQESFNSNLEEILFAKESDGRTLIQ